MTFMDQTWCTDDKCITLDCFRHPNGLKKNYQNLPISISEFKACTLRKHKDVWPEDHERINAIGRNGNNGEHYEQCVYTEDLYDTNSDS